MARDKKKLFFMARGKKSLATTDLRHACRSHLVKSLFLHKVDNFPGQI
jgi:hypothetical protein